VPPVRAGLQQQRDHLGRARPQRWDRPRAWPYANPAQESQLFVGPRTRGPGARGHLARRGARGGVAMAGGAEQGGHVPHAPRLTDAVDLTARGGRGGGGAASAPWPPADAATPIQSR
jgi:hypothetical protein